MGALVCKLSDLETPQLKIYLPICKERSSGLSATAVCWRQPSGGRVAAALAWRRQCGGGSTYDVLHWAEEVRVRVLPIPAQGSDPCITCVPLNMTCVQKKSRILIYYFLRTNGQFQKRIDSFYNLYWKLHLESLISISMKMCLVYKKNLIYSLFKRNLKGEPNWFFAIYTIRGKRSQF